MKSFDRLVEIIAQLRDPVKGCPWDIKQTHESLKPYLIEEAYETLDAIDSSPEKIKEELGDVLLQVLLHSQIASDEKRFSIEDVAETLSKKLIARHPHVFGDAVAKDAEHVIKQWEEIKKADRPASDGLLDSLPKGCPALLHSELIGKKVAKVGFDWETAADIKGKVKEELDEFLEDCIWQDGDKSRVEEELGDLLFTVAQLGRKLGFSPEVTLRRANEKFSARFRKLEVLANNKLDNLSREKLEELWQQVKISEKSGGAS